VITGMVDGSSAVSSTAPLWLLCETGDRDTTTGASVTTAVGGADPAAASAMTDGNDEMPGVASDTVSMAMSSSSAGISFVTSHWITQAPAHDTDRCFYTAIRHNNEHLHTAVGPTITTENSLRHRVTV